MKKDILSMDPAELKAEIVQLGQPEFRAKQIRDWLSKGVRSFGEMKNLPKSLISALDENYHLYEPKILEKKVSTDGTVKYLWELFDGNAVETVIMRYRYGNTVCVSSQVGCRQGCAFCASTIGGLVRNLNASEILDEVVFSQKDSGLKISNIVMMGIGEPLDNFDNVVRFLQLVNDPDGMNIGMRHITISTCGLCERFGDLASLGYQVTLSLSLHAPDDETRSKIMPANRSRGVDAVLDAVAKDAPDRAALRQELADVVANGGTLCTGPLAAIQRIEDGYEKKSAGRYLRRISVLRHKEGTTGSLVKIECELAWEYIPEAVREQFIKTRQEKVVRLVYDAKGSGT